jgi:hypothetical protein
MGKIISKAKNCHLVHEPLNKDFGVKGLSCWYPHLEENDLENDLGVIKTIQDIVSFKAKWTHTAPSDYPVITRLSKVIYGGRSGLNWSLLKLKHRLGYSFQTVCLKDPFSTFAVDHLARVHNARVICMIRHPCALYLSYIKQNIRVNMDDLRKENEFCSRYAEDIPSGVWRSAEQNKAAEVALLWKIMARTITSQDKRLKNLLLIRHEDLCVDPIKMVNNAYHFLGLSFSQKAERFIHKTCKNHRIRPKKDKFHSFKRNSLGLKDAWRDAIDPEDEKSIQNIVGNDIFLVYENW